MTTAVAVAAAVEVATRHGVTVREPVVLADRANVLVHLAPAPLVARIPARVRRIREHPEAWLAREVAVQGHAAARGGPVLPVTDLLPPGPHEARGRWMTFSALAPPAAAGTAPPVALGASLADLHASLADFPDQLPLLVPVLDDVAAQIDLHRRVGDPAVAADWAARLTALAPRLRALPTAPAVHGDAHAGNAILAGDRVVWIDFEDTCRAPLGWDLACQRPETRAGYPDPPPAEVLAPLVEARQLQADAWTATLRLPS